MSDTLYTTPEIFTEQAIEIEERQFRTVGQAIARTLELVENQEARELAAAHLMALQANLTLQIQAHDTLRVRQAQAAYLAGVTAGYIKLGQEMGLVEKPLTAPVITH